MAKRGTKLDFSIGEVVLCFEPDPTKARVLYDAKVLDSQVTKDKQGRKCAAYLVHFQGWNSSWDRLVPETFILKASEENKALMKRLTETANKYRKNSQRRRKIDRILRAAQVQSPVGYESEVESDNSESEYVETDSNEDEDASHLISDKSGTENGKRGRRRKQPQNQYVPVVIEIPDVLKSRLEEDYVAVSTKSKLCSLPARPCVLEILEGFLKTFCVNYICEPSELQNDKEKDKTHLERNILKIPPTYLVTLCKELVDGLRILFDFTLPIILLYATEQEQYEEVMKNSKPDDIMVNIDGEKANSADSKHCRTMEHGRTTSQKHGRIEKEDGAEDGGNPAEVSSRRVTRRSNLDAQHSLEDHLGPTSPVKRPKKQVEILPSSLDDGLVGRGGQFLLSAQVMQEDGPHSPKHSPRMRRRRGIHDDPLGIKVEDHSDSEAELSLPSSAVPLIATTNGVIPVPNPWNLSAPLTRSAAGSVGSACLMHKKKEDLMENILSWQILPSEVRCKSPLTPSQVYGIQHLLRLFVKLPQLLNRMPFDNSKLQVLVKLCQQCLQYFVEHQTEFYR